jgi:MFS transporter, ACS family, hexuronate transporter
VSQPIERSLSPGRAWTLALVATFTMSISYVDRQTLSVLAPTVTRELNISEQGYGWLASAFSIADLVGAPIAGRLIDRVGARRGLFGAVLLWSTVAALHALVPGFFALFALRILLGLAEAPSFPGAAQTVHRVLPPASRARGLGILFTGSSIGAMLAPLLATSLARHFGWRAAFLGSAIVGLVWVPLWLAVTSAPEVRRVMDGESVARTTTPAPRMLDVVLHPAVLRAIAVVVASAPAIAFVLLWGSKFLVRHDHLDPAEVGAFLWIPPLFFDVGAVLFGDLASRRARRSGHDGSSPRTLLAIATLLAVTIALAPFAPTPLLSMLLAGIALAGGGGLFALLTADMLARVSPQAISLAGGCTAAAQSLAYIVANPLIGAAVQRGASYSSVLVVLAAWTVPGCVLWLVTKAPPETAESRAGAGLAR